MAYLLAALCLLAACTTRATVDDAEQADSAAGPTQVPDAASSPGDGNESADAPGTFNDPSAGPNRAADEPRQVPPLNLPASAPGTDQAATELLDELDRFVTADERQAGIPWPDLRNPDPIAAYQAAATFQNWMSGNNPTPTLVEAYTAPSSPERGFDLEMFNFRNNFDLRSAP